MGTKMGKHSDFQTIAKAWRKQFGAPMPVAGELEAAWEVLKDGDADLPPPTPRPKPTPDQDD